MPASASLADALRRLALLFAVIAFVSLGAPAVAPAAPLPVTATGETDPVHNSGDAADDAAIWIHPTDPSLSTVIATDKSTAGGLVVYDLAGKELGFYPDGRLNNVDVRYNFPLGDRRVDLVAATNRVARRIDFYTANPDRTLTRIGGVPTSSAILTPRGISLYHSPVTGTYYAFVTDVGNTDQYELSGAGGTVTGRVVRQWKNTPAHTEGLVADDERAVVYLAVEDVGGIFRYGAEPGDGTANIKVDGTTESGGNIVQDVKGLAMYYGRNGAGYLVAISQGGNSFHLYDRGFTGTAPNAHRGEFAVVAGNGIDEVTGIDGADVTNVGLGSRFPNGMFVTQDTSNPGYNQNFKLVPWPSIAGAFSPMLVVDPMFDPRSIGGDSKPPEEDAVAPDTAIDAGPSGSLTATSATFSFSSTETGSTFSCSLDGAPFSPCSSPTTYSGLAPGPHAFAVRSTDAAGNTDATPANRTWTIESSGQPTTVRVVAAADAHVREAAPSTNYGSASELRTDAGTGVGEHSYFRFDVAGIEGRVTAAKVRAWVTNGTTNGPRIFGVGAQWNELGLTWSNRPAPLGSASDDKASVPSGGWMEYDVTPLVTTNGTHAFVTVPDSTDALVVSSRETANPPTLELTIEQPTTKDGEPQTTIESGPSGTVTSTSATFAFSSSETGSTFACSLDGAPFSSCTSPTTYENLAPGIHAFDVRATDADGTTDTTPAHSTWTVEAARPVILSVPATADTFVRESSPMSNFGASSVLNVDGGTGTNEHAYFRFEVSGVSGAVTNAKLRAWVTNGTVNGPTIFLTDSLWTELGMTWSSRAPTIGAASDDKGSVPSKSWVEYDVTPLVSGNGAYSFVTVPASTDGMDVSSREAVNRPTLVLTVSP